MTRTLGISTLAWTPAQDEWVAAQLQRFGVRALDLTPSKYFDLTAPDLTAARRLREWWEVRGYTLSGMQSLLFGQPELQVFGPPAVQARMLKHLEQVYALAATLGTAQLTFGSPRQRDKGQLSDQAAWDKGQQFFGRAGDLAARYGVTLALESNPPVYGANFLTTTLETAQFVRELDHPNIRLQLDSGALMLEGFDPATVLPLVAKWVSHVHLSLPHLRSLDTALPEFLPPQLLRAALPQAVWVAEMLPPPSEQAFIEALKILKCYGAKA